ncbi:N-acetylglucosamine-6-phosphate deacetylase [Gelidibacter algens]|uniref:N-acetylglucosamine-6-phosphate deacetylase n=1 Tax=Gelidibacter algens TaxID=49280 RepID=A0A1A7R5M0_9FLAO|nr:amidohydrolase family protein [Gelidibacter algens]OBX26052.1 N-acetylglucosamine-6-phosphate deacetylase [Gelidibacter algens]RAJ27673.1 N-acetylglucosamine-6-phosphate deacetylase [Gelidibacter algens]
MVLEALDYRTDQPIRLEIAEGSIIQISECPKLLPTNSYIAPGLVDLQINGFKGIDFNTKGLSVSDVEALTHILFEKGITSYFPTIITNSDTATESLIKLIASACESNTEINTAIGGIHLEGPFLSPEDGPRGAHPREFIKAPDWDLFSKWQRVAGGRLRIITLSPEWPESIDFIKRCTDSGVIVSIGHTAANPEQINQAIAAGASMSTHLGNASHAMLPRHSNYVWEQLASDNLWSTLIADGFHLPDALLKIFLRTKPNKSLLVSDATSYAELPTGSYSGHIGGNVELDATGRLFMKERPSMLAGSAQSLLWCVNQLIRKNILPLPEAWNMASIKPTEAIFGKVTNDLKVGQPADLVVFERENDNLKIIKTIKNGKIVFSIPDEK